MVLDIVMIVRVEKIKTSGRRKREEQEQGRDRGSDGFGLAFKRASRARWEEELVVFTLSIWC